MANLYLIYEDENKDEDNDVVAVFNSHELAKAFTERHVRFHGQYRIEETQLNPTFQRTDKWLYLVIIDPAEDFFQASRANTFREEKLAYHAPVSKHEDTFYMYLFANDKKDALSLATTKFDEMRASGEWLLINDEADNELYS